MKCMNTSLTLSLPRIVAQAFPVLTTATYIRSFAPPVPLCPDTIYHIFLDNHGQLYVLVVTDHPDLSSQQAEFKHLSGVLGLAYDQPLNHPEDTDEIFFVRTPGARWYYYAITVKRTETDDNQELQDVTR